MLLVNYKINSVLDKSAMLFFSWVTFQTSIWEVKTIFIYYIHYIIIYSYIHLYISEYLHYIHIHYIFNK